MKKYEIVKDITKELLTELLSARDVISEGQSNKIIESARVIDKDKEILDIEISAGCTNTEDELYNNYCVLNDMGVCICEFYIYSDGDILVIENIEEEYEVS